MQCKNCGYTADADFKFCPECGTPAPDRDAADEQSQIDSQAAADRDAAEQARLQSERIAYVRRDYDPCRDGRYPGPGYAAPCDPSVTPDSRQPAAQQARVFSAGQSAVQRPSTTGTIVLAIINILCCGFGVSMVLGLIALVFAILSSSETSEEEAGKKIRWARTFNIIGLAFIVLQLLVLVALIIGSLLLSQGGPAFSPNSFPRDFPMG